MNYFRIIGTLFCLLFIFISKPLSLENKILFKINNDIITSIDVEEEYRYLIALNNNLKTLPENQLESGFAEVVKHALISDKDLWESIRNSLLKDLNWGNVIETSVKIKNNIVVADPKENTERKKLNFGHTFGHAIESYYLQKGTPILHGEAIFMGIILESELSSLSYSEKNQIKNYILSNFQLPHCPSKSELLNFMRNDKKNLEGRINFSLLNEIGNCTINNLFSEDEL